MNEFERKRLGETAAWAQQTIAFAIGLRARDSGKPFENMEKHDFARKEIDARTDELWEKTEAEIPVGTNLQGAIEAYARKVFDWCDNHMHPDS